MTTAAERLLQLANTTGTAGALLLMIGTGATAGAALVDYSALPSATASTHLLTNRITEQIGSAWMPAPERFKPRRRPRDEDEAILLAVVLH